MLMAFAVLAVLLAGCSGRRDLDLSTASTCREFMAAGFDARGRLYEQSAGSGYWPAVEDVMLVCDAFPAIAVSDALAIARALD